MGGAVTVGGPVGGASSPPGAAPGRGREAVAAAAARAQRRGDWLWRPETSGSRGPSGSPARRGAVGLSAHGSEEGSCAAPPSAAVFGLRRLSRTPLHTPRRLHPRGRRSPPRWRAHHDEERQEVLQPKPGRVEALHLQPDHRSVPGAHRQELGRIPVCGREVMLPEGDMLSFLPSVLSLPLLASWFDLALLPSILWVPGCTLHIHNVGYASDSER